MNSKCHADAGRSQAAHRDWRRRWVKRHRDACVPYNRNQYSGPVSNSTAEPRRHRRHGLRAAVPPMHFQSRLASIALFLSLSFAASGHVPSAALAEELSEVNATAPRRPVERRRSSGPTSYLATTAQGCADAIPEGRRCLPTPASRDRGRCRCSQQLVQDLPGTARAAQQPRGDLRRLQWRVRQGAQPSSTTSLRLNPGYATGERKSCRHLRDAGRAQSYAQVRSAHRAGPTPTPAAQARARAADRHSRARTSAGRAAARGQRSAASAGFIEIELDPGGALDMKKLPVSQIASWRWLPRARSRFAAPGRRSRKK